MLKTRVIPCLLLQDTGLVKTTKFKKPFYIGDPVNAVKIFNDKEVDELVFLDISATAQKKEPNFELIKDIATETFMPFGYGGGITKLEHIEKLFYLGVEKVVLNTIVHQNPSLVSEAARIFGSQSIVVSIDYKVSLFGNSRVYVAGGKINTKKSPIEYAIEVQKLGAGEIFLNSIIRDGTFNGYDLKTIKEITSVIDIPLVACGGAAGLSDFLDAVREGGASGVAAGSLFVFQGVHKAVLITYPDYNELEKLFR